jgi:hypothetical protein
MYIQVKTFLYGYACILPIPLSPIPDFKNWLKQFLEVLYIYMYKYMYIQVKTFLYGYACILPIPLSPIPDFKNWLKQFLEVLYIYTYI